MAKQAKLTIHDFIFKPILYLLLAQVGILLFCSIIYNGDVNRYIDCDNATIRVEDKYVVSYGHRPRITRFFVNANGEEYQFSETVYTAYELDKEVSIGEKIDVFYVKKYSLSRGDYYYVIDARYGNEIYESIDEYNARRKNNAIGVFISFEVILVLVTVVTAFICEYDLKDFLKKLKKKIKKVKRQKEKVKGQKAKTNKK